ncbi:MAG TPA: helix-turn-helix transcriptional regulator [Dictyoglomaceae bacterium]|nr:helix-turn-helix transcriptional regulator [Dictyoglomaceae bacterium]HOL39071.1 helix-turn-helix transcriptional regulator [Dictyoglomaceae bacterium]HOP94410.1 helix-turn-helix transcriptional regulator [Dictyoglomaceae bacterium]HPP15753.1 helix-turn-helix transcriptional regulator [Dictyoglomaceae bacterium]HPU42741.1 helix-turn-helix transcriptional regulator [Dictyoglomaceae bacterium]
MNVGNRIRELRKNKNLKLEDLANMTGLSLSYISLVERGLKHPSLKALEKIADAFNVPTSFLFTEDKEENLEAFLRTNTNLDDDERKMIIQLINSLEKKKSVRKSN